MEKWKEIKGYEGRYWISNKGRICSREGILHPHTHPDGYKDIKLSRGKNDRKNKRVHRLVAEAFIPNPDNKPQINHIDSNKANNNVENLEWCTDQENKLHASEYGDNMKISNEDAKKIRESSLSQRQLAQLYGVSKSTIQRIKSGTQQLY